MLNFVQTVIASTAFLVALTATAAPDDAAAATGPTAHKVYADYHNARYTREHDGAVGVWKYSAMGRNSQVENPVVNRNPDLIDERGRHELAAADYPLVGMQSELDPDYLEYQVLSAKAAHIDGFFVEWGYEDHASERIRRALTAVASRYNFEIGINLCDHWLFSQLPAKHPELKSRAQLVAEFARNYAALLRTLAAERVSVRYHGRPVVLLFGGGLTEDEFQDVRHRASEAVGFDPCVLIRPQIVGRPSGADGITQQWERSGWFTPKNGYLPGIAGYFGWVPTRARTQGNPALLRQFDRYGTVEDSLDYLRLITSAPGGAPRVSSATPGFDNRACAGWGSDFSVIERGQGENYEAMWKFNLANTDRIDWVFLPTWNDWTEGSQIEPSVEDQGLFLRLTAVAASRFKGEKSAPTLAGLPPRLFQLRQRLRRLQRIARLEPSSDLATLDRAAQAIARRDEAAAITALDQVERSVMDREAHLPAPREITWIASTADRTTGTTATADGTIDTPVRWRMDESIAATFRDHGYEAELEFEFKPLARGRLVVTTDTARRPSPVGDFGVVADITLLRAAGWQHAKVALVPANCAWQHHLDGGNDLAFTGPVQIRNLRLVGRYWAPAPARGSDSTGLSTSGSAPRKSPSPDITAGIEPPARPTTTPHSPPATGHRPGTKSPRSAPACVFSLGLVRSPLLPAPISAPLPRRSNAAPAG